MMNMDRRSFLAFSLAASATTTSAAEWNQWRGPSRNGLVGAEDNWPSSLKSLETVWRTELGPSYSGPVVAEGRVFVTETTDKKYEVVSAYALGDGESLWRTDWPGAMKVPFFAASNGSWIRSTPAVSGNRLLVAGMRDVLVCMQSDTGAELWRNDFVETQKSKLPSFGYVSSPIIIGDFAYVQAGGAFLKLEMETGRVVWRALDDGGGMYGSAFSSPVLATIAGKEQLVVQTRKELAGVDPESGAKLWAVDVPAFRGMNILPPTVHGDTVFTSTYGGGSFCFDVKNSAAAGWKVTQLWKNTVQGYMSSPMVFDSHVYVHLKNRRFSCMDLNSGSQKWSSKPFGQYWSMVAQGNRILALDERGELLLVEPSTEEFKLVDRFKVTSNAWAHLAVVDDLVLVRDLNALTVYRWA